jgi:hypothetical protein
VVVGVTDCAPPVPGSMNVVLSTLSEITTCVALLAVTVSMEAVPVVTELGLAVTFTVGADGGGVVAFALLPQEVNAATPANATQLSPAAHKQRAASLRFG